MTCLGRGDGDGAAAAACVLRSSVVAERARRGGRVCVAATARRVCCVNVPRDGGSGAVVVWWRGGRDAAGASRQCCNARFRRSVTCLDELLEGLDYYRVDIRHGLWSLPRCYVYAAATVSASRVTASEAHSASI